MKKLHLLLLSITLCLFSACHNDIWDAIDGLDSRVTKLEELCKEMNTNITSLQTIVSVLQSNDFITGIVEIKKNGEVIGYTITFGKHDPITIYHGQDGKDGADGKDGQDGQNGSANAPVIGVAQDTDGVYYWTLNGEWLLNDNGNKLPVSGKDGQNGVNGTMPQLKIEEGYWYVSYDNGVTWTQLGKATGEDGKKGDKGDIGDSMFQSVTQDENYVYFTLADGTVIKIAKGDANTNTKEYYFSVSDSTKVCFSKGNLQYQASTKTYRFAENQLDYIGEGNINRGESYDGWIDLFKAGTGENPLGSFTVRFVDWGINPIGDDPANTWRTLTYDEFKYLCERADGALIGVAHINNTRGVIIFPDSWSLFVEFTKNEARSLSDTQWKILEEEGAIFLPSTGYLHIDQYDRCTYERGNSMHAYVSHYWTSSTTIVYERTRYYSFSLYNASYDVGHSEPEFGSVRLVKDAK